jgi:hypothetical protein
MAIFASRQILGRRHSSGRLAIGALGLGCLAVLAGCGSAAKASPGASATATCPPVGAFKSVSGTISGTGNNTITVTNSSGAQVVVQLTSSTRISKQVTVAPASIATGTNVLVISDTNATTAQRISVLSGTGTGGFGGFGGGFGRFGGQGTPTRGTPGANRNSACFARTPGAGRPTPGTGTNSGVFQGLRGTVASVSASPIIINDPQGQTFALAITPSTVITTIASGTTADLVNGARVTASGMAAGSQIKATTIALETGG